MNKYLIFIFSISLLSAQWFEGNLYLPDSFGGTCETHKITWNSIDDRIYLLGWTQTFVTIDGESDEKIQPIRINGNTRSNYDWLEWNGGNNCLYIWCNPYPSFYDSLYIVDCQTRQTVNVISFPRQNAGAGNEAQMCASPVSNKVYLIKEDNHAGSGYDTLIYAIDGNTHQIIKRIRCNTYSVYHPDYPSLKWNPVNNCLYAIGQTLDSNTAGLAVIDCTIDSIISFSPLPHEVLVERNSFVLDSLDNKLYFSLDDTLGKGIYEFDCSSNTIVQRINIPNAENVDVIDFALDPGNNKIYYSNFYSEFIYVIDIPSGTVTDSILVNENIEYLAFYPPNNELYCIRGDTLSVIDLLTNSVSRYGLPDENDVEARPFLHPIRGKLYLSRGVGEAVVIFDCLTKTVRNVIFNGTLEVSGLLLNPIEHKLYCSNGYRPYIFIFDSENQQAIRQLQVAPNGERASCLGFASRQNKIYIAKSSYQIVVLDSRNDSIIKIIDATSTCYDAVYNPIVDKLYTKGGGNVSFVIDCANDSIVKVLTTTVGGDIKFDTLTNKIYMTGNKFVIIDCSDDSVIKRDSSIRGGNIHFRSHGDLRVYAGKAMVDRFADTLIGYLPFTFSQSEYNSTDDKLYLAQDPSNTNKIYVVDCNTNNLSDSILGGMPGFITGLFWNELNDKLYFSPLNNQIWYEPVMVADCRTNEIVATFPQIDRADLQFNRCLDLSNNLLYVAVWEGSRLGMIRDNIYGIEEIEKKQGELKVYPTLGRRFNIESDKSIDIKIYNALGEKVTEFSSGKQGVVTWDGNDSRGEKLSKGVYFLIPEPKNQNKQSGSEQKLPIKKLVLF